MLGYLARIFRVFVVRIIRTVLYKRVIEAGRPTGHLILYQQSCSDRPNCFVYIVDTVTVVGHSGAGAIPKSNS